MANLRFSQFVCGTLSESELSDLSEQFGTHS